MKVVIYKSKNQKLYLIQLDYFGCQTSKSEKF